MHATFEFVGSQIAECELPRGKGVDLVGGTEPVEPCSYFLSDGLPTEYFINLQREKVLQEQNRFSPSLT